METNRYIRCSYRIQPGRHNHSGPTATCEANGADACAGRRREGGGYFWEANGEVEGGGRSIQVYGVAAGEKNGG
jgi:hypothetical protein